MLKPSPKLCSEHTKSDSSHYPDPDVLPYSLTSVSYVPFLPFLILFIFNRYFCIKFLYSSLCDSLSFHVNYLPLYSSFLQQVHIFFIPSDLCILDSACFLFSYSLVLALFFIAFIFFYASALGANYPFMDLIFLFIILDLTQCILLSIYSTVVDIQVS